MDVGKPFDYLRAKLDRSKEVITEEIARDILEQCERLAKHVEQYLYKSGLIPSKQDT